MRCFHSPFHQWSGIYASLMSIFSQQTALLTQSSLYTSESIQSCFSSIGCNEVSNFILFQTLLRFDVIKCLQSIIRFSELKLVPTIYFFTRCCRLNITCCLETIDVSAQAGKAAFAAATADSISTVVVSGHREMTSFVA